MCVCVCVCVTSTTTFWQKTTQNTWANWTFSIQIAMLPFLVPLFSRISLPGLGLGSSGTFAEAKEKATSAWTSHGNWYHYRYPIGWFSSKVAKTSHHQYQWWRHLPGEVWIICLTNTSRFPVFLRGFFQLSWPWPHISLPIDVCETLCGDAEASENPQNFSHFGEHPLRKNMHPFQA